MARILIIGNPHSPLVSRRGMVGRIAGHEIVWFWPTPFSIPGITTYSMPRKTGLNILLRACLEFVYLAKAIRESKPDLIHVHYASKGLSAIPLSLHHPLVVTTMGSDVSPTVGYRGVYKIFTKVLLDAADLITSKSSHMDSLVLAIGDYSTKIRRITWGVDLRDFADGNIGAGLKARLDISKTATVFFDPRAAKRLYNKHIIISAFAKFIESRGPEAVLLVSEFSADPRYLRELKALVGNLGLTDRVLFLPGMNHSEMAKYYAISNVVVSIPISDGFPQTIYEAWASGCYLILSDLPQYREAVSRGKAARVVDVGSVDDLARAMLELAVNPHGFREELLEAKHFVEEHANWAEQKQHMLQIYSELLNS